MSEKPTTTRKPIAVDAEEARERIHALVDRLPASELERTAMILRSLVEDDRFLWKHATAPEEDEPLTEEEKAKIRRGLEEAGRGERRLLEDVESEFDR